MVIGVIDIDWLTHSSIHSLIIQVHGKERWVADIDAFGGGGSTSSEVERTLAKTSWSEASSDSQELQGRPWFLLRYHAASAQDKDHLHQQDTTDLCG